MKRIKMFNRRGFTLIEVIGAVIILGILAIISITYFTRNLEDFREDYYKNIESNLLSSGREFYTDNRLYLPTKYLEASKVTLNTLESKKYIDEVLDYEGNSCNKDSYVIVIKKSKDEYDYHLCLKCEADDYDDKEKLACDSVWMSNDTLTVEMGSPAVVYIYKGASREELRNKVKLAADIVRYNNKGEEIARVSGSGEDGIPEILPVNLDTIDVNKTGEYKIVYEYGGETREGTVIVYENVSPGISINKVNRVREGSATSELKEKRSKYNDGDWAQKLEVSLGVVDTGTSYNEATKLVNYQWKRGERWIDFCSPDNNGECVRTIDEEMNETVYFRAIDNEGNISMESGPYVFKIDNTAPICELSLSGTMGSDNWYTSNVEVSFGKALEQVKDNRNAVSGIKRKGITLNQIGTELTKTQTADTASVTYYGVIEDNAENSSVCQISFKKDGTSPTVSYSLAGGNYNGTRNVTVTANDTNFGYMNVQVNNNSGMVLQQLNIPTNTYTVSLNSASNWTVYVQAFDKAGNKQKTAPLNENGWTYQQYVITTQVEKCRYRDVWYACDTCGGQQSDGCCGGHNVNNGWCIEYCTWDCNCGNRYGSWSAYSTEYVKYKTDSSKQTECAMMNP